MFRRPPRSHLYYTRLPYPPLFATLPAPPPTEPAVPASSRPPVAPTHPPALGRRRFRRRDWGFPPARPTRRRAARDCPASPSTHRRPSTAPRPAAPSPCASQIGRAHV